MKTYNIRVYGLLFNAEHQLLLSDEYRFETKILKFPGGGLEWGESLPECLQREFKEEFGIEIQVAELLFVNDFFVPSAFNGNQQMFCFYYRVEYIDKSQFESAILHPTSSENPIWKDLDSILESDFTFPIDRIFYREVLVKKKANLF
jgi:8-oxo-dGTP pyrophosphatase MutT (NUDIX family)